MTSEAELLEWRCTKCAVAEPVDNSDGQGYAVGDREPCVHCPEGTAYVVDANAVRRNPCEWDPRTEQAALSTLSAHDVATVTVGANGRWRLCDSCAALPIFKRFRWRRRIRRAGGAR